MAKIAFILGIVGSVITGLTLSSRLVHRDYTTSVVATGIGHSCPTLGVNFDKSAETIPAAVTSCACPAPPAIDGGATPIHPPAELVAAAAVSDQIGISYTEFTSPLNKKKETGLSFTLFKGSDKQTWVASSAWPAYSSFAFLTAIPFFVGVVLSIIFTFMPKKNKGTGSFS